MTLSNVYYVNIFLCLLMMYSRIVGRTVVCFIRGIYFIKVYICYGYNILYYLIFIVAILVDGREFIEVRDLVTATRS